VETQTPPLQSSPAPLDGQALARIRSEIQLDDRAKIATFGDRAQRNVTGFSD
jgi:hypothetical protein